MKKTDKNLYLLYMIFAVSLITANCIASKIMILPFSLFGSAVTVTVGIICYPITFLVTDIIGEVWGKKQANYAVLFGLICQVISTAIVCIARYLPAVDGTVQDAYVTLLGQNYIFVIASLVAYICSQKWDVWVFHSIRDKYIVKHGTTAGGRWIWNNASTVTSQLIDSAIYVFIAFGIGFKWLGDASMIGTMINMVLAQWILKAILALCDTPIFYLCTNNTVKKEH